MWIARARPLLGTVVAIHAHADPGDASHVVHAISEAFAVMAHIGNVMSAHHRASDLARLSRATPGETLCLDAQTMCVLKAAQYWWRLSRGAFNPCHAAQSLSHKGVRPGLAALAMGSLSDLDIRSSTHVRCAAPVQLDFGGIAKGFAVDRAIEVLSAHGVQDTLVNAGGDLRAMGKRQWPIDVRHAKREVADGRLGQKIRIQQQALATSVSGALNPEFVLTQLHKKPKWRSVSVQAATCMAADALTKWAMQSSLLCPDLRAALRQNQGRLWRTQ